MTALLAHKIAYPKEFEAFWEAYPQRDGSNPKHAAFVAWGRARKIASADDILQAVQRYAATVEVGSRFVCHAATWLNQRRFIDVKANAKEAEKVPPEKRWDWVCRMFAKTGVWYSMSPAPGYAGCQCPPELLKRYGLV